MVTLYGRLRIVIAYKMFTFDKGLTGLLRTKTSSAVVSPNYKLSLKGKKIISKILYCNCISIK